MRFRGHGWLALRPWRRHSLVLAVAGMVYVCYGMAMVLITPDQQARAAREHTLTIPAQLMPFQAWGCVWILVGLLALASTRWPPTSETWGYAAMTYIAAFWSACYGLGVLLLGSPTTGVTGMLVWALMAFMWWGISGLENPDDMAKTPYVPPEMGERDG